MTGPKEQAVEKMLHESPETIAIRQRMQEVRCDLDEGVQEIVEGARVLGKWRYYVRNYPGICLTAALAAGYLIVPRRPLGTTSAELAQRSRFPETPPAAPHGNVRGILLTFLGNLVMRGVSSYVQNQAGKLFAAQSARSPQDEQL